jgi:oxygen-independent coproporphyrinogen-3 oxidase
LKEAERFLSDGLLRKEGNRLVLTRKGLFVSDMVMSGLIYV